MKDVQIFVNEPLSHVLYLHDAYCWESLQKLLETHIFSLGTFRHCWQTVIRSFVEQRSNDRLAEGVRSHPFYIFAAMTKESRMYFVLADIAISLLLPYFSSIICLICGSIKHENHCVNYFCHSVKIRPGKAWKHNKKPIFSIGLNFSIPSIFQKCCLKQFFTSPYFIHCGLASFHYNSYFVSCENRSKTFGILFSLSFGI